MRVDEKTKEVIQEWSLTNIKRWAASPKSFTLVGAGIPTRKGFGIIREELVQRSFLPPLGDSRKKELLWEVEVRADRETQGVDDA